MSTRHFGSIEKERFENQKQKKICFEYMVNKKLISQLNIAHNKFH